VDYFTALFMFERNELHTDTLCSDGDWKQVRIHYSSIVQTLVRGDKRQKKKQQTNSVSNVSHKREERIIF